MKTKPLIPWHEKALALVGALTLAFTAWGFGGVIDWSLHIMLAGGLLTFALAIFPNVRGQRPEGRGQKTELGEQKAGSMAQGVTAKRSVDIPVHHHSVAARTTEVSHRVKSSASPAFIPKQPGNASPPTTHLSRRLVRANQREAPINEKPERLNFTPAHWLSLLFAAAFLAYLAISAFNPAWRIASDERGWWLESVVPPLAAWLPTSVEARYEPMNVWRIFNMHLAAFSLALGLYFGLSSRRAVLFVFWFFLVNVALMAAVAIVQKYTSAGAVLWMLPSQNRNFWGSFFYRNQGAAFLNWGIVVAAVLYFYHSGKARLLMRSGGPHFLAFCLIGLIALSVTFALSRGGILFASLLVLVFVILAIAHYFYGAATQLNRHTLILTGALTFILTFLLSAGLYQLNRNIDWQAIEKRFGDIEATIDNADRDARMLSTKATWVMAQDQLWAGWGAGSFRYAFPMYQQDVPELFYSRNHRKRGWEGRKFYRYAHNDIVQFLAEYGIVGCSLLGLTILSLLAPALRYAGQAPLSTLFLLLGIAAALAHAFIEFIFHSPAYWVSFITMIALTSRLLQLTAYRRRKSET